MSLLLTQIRHCGARTSSTQYSWSCGRFCLRMLLCKTRVAPQALLLLLRCALSDSPSLRMMRRLWCCQEVPHHCSRNQHEWEGARKRQSFIGRYGVPERQLIRAAAAAQCCTIDPDCSMSWLCLTCAFAARNTDFLDHPTDIGSHEV